VENRFRSHHRVDSSLSPSLECNDRNLSSPPEATLTFSATIKAILTDVQFWIPAVVLALGVALLVWLH